MAPGSWPSTGYGRPSPLKRAIVALTGTGDVVAAVTDRRIKVYHYEVQSENDGMSVQFRDGASGAFLGIKWLFDAREGCMASPGLPTEDRLYIFATTAGNALRAVISGAGTVNIAVSYWDEDPA